MRLKFMRLKLSHICAGLDHVFLLMCKEISFQQAQLKLSLKTLYFQPKDIVWSNSHCVFSRLKLSDKKTGPSKDET